MARIEIPTYGLVCENEFYSRKTNGLFSHGRKSEPSTELLWISKFKVPTKEETIDYIVLQAKALKLEKNKNIKEELALKKILQTFSFLIDPIAKKDNSTLDHLNDHYFNGYPQAGRSYLITAIGEVPDQVLNEAKKLVKKQGTLIYGVCLQRFSSNWLRLKLRLLENCLMPNSSELEYLIERGVRVSDVFLVDGESKEYSRVAHLIRSLSGSLDAEKISYLRDQSLDELNQKAISIISATGQCTALSGAVRNLPDILMSLFEEEDSL